MFTFDNTFAASMAGLFSRQEPLEPPTPRLVLYNTALARALGLDHGENPGQMARLLSGKTVPAGAEPIAMVYAGHQFGGFSPRLGDGRALLLGEILGPSGARYDVQLKGSGPTPYSRGGDGLLALGPALREFVISEALAGLGIPTTRSLAVVSTGVPVYRERVLDGAVLTRIAASHLRIGSFEYVAAAGDGARLHRLADYAIARHYPDLAGDDRYFGLFRAVVDAQADLVARWMSVGFVHGVMNTDNTTISGETIDFGPCAFIDTYRTDQVFSSIDHFGRYAFGNQPVVVRWNLARFAETLIGLVDADEARAVARLTEALGDFDAIYRERLLGLMRGKLGLAVALPGDQQLVDGLLAAMEQGEADHTLVFRALADVLRGEDAPFLGCFADPAQASAWLMLFKGRHALEPRPVAARAAAMDRINPLIIARNHAVEEALAAATDAGDPAPVLRLAECLADPFTARADCADLARPRAGHDRAFVTFCGT